VVLNTVQQVQRKTEDGMMEWTGERNVLDLGIAVRYIAGSSNLQRLVERGLVSHAETIGMILHARVVDHPSRRPYCGLAVTRLLVFLECECAFG
jgi:hypothetical protein